MRVQLTRYVQLEVTKVGAMWVGELPAMASPSARRCAINLRSLGHNVHVCVTSPDTSENNTARPPTRLRATMAARRWWDDGGVSVPWPPLPRPPLMGRREHALTHRAAAHTDAVVRCAEHPNMARVATEAAAAPAVATGCAIVRA
jgi:hypothetical protein